MKHLGTIVRVATVALSLAVGSNALAAVQFTLSATSSSSSMGLQTYATRGGSAAVSMDVGSNLRVGLTHRQEIDAKEGYESSKNSAGDVTYTPFASSTKLISNSVDLTLILYTGQTFVPYIFAGGVWKSYHSVMYTSKGTQTLDVPFVGPLPNGGAGVMLPLSQKFSLRLTYTLSPGFAQNIDGSRANVLDSYTQLGITYQL